MTMTEPYRPGPYHRGSPLSRSFLPLALITLGVVFLLGNLVPERGRGGLILLGLGAAFAIGRVTTGRYGYSVPAGLLLAIGAHVSLEQVEGVRGLASGGLFFVLLGLGFVAIYVLGMRPLAVWPLVPGAILVGLGLVMLGVSSLAPLASLSWIVNFWPVALVLLGVWLLFRDSLPTQAQRPIATFGGLALLAYGILAAAASVAAGGAIPRTGTAAGFGPSPLTDTVTLEQPIADGQTFSVNNATGRTIIHGGSGSVVHVVATRHSRMGGQGPDVRLTPTGSGVNLDSSPSHGGFPFADANWVEYDVEVPATVAVKAQTTSGSLEIDGVSGTVDATTNSGEIRGSALRHLHQAQTSNGSISLEGVFTDQARVATSSGSVTVKLLPGTAVDLDVHTGSGSVEPQNLVLSGGVTRRDTLQGAIGSPTPGATLTIQTSSGSVYISQ
jgi:Putative adhesin